MARRRVDRGRPRQQDRARHGTYCDVRRERRDRVPVGPQYRPESISAYQQFQPGPAARFRGTPTSRAGGLANPRRWNGDCAVNAMTHGMTAFSLAGSAPLNNAEDLE